MIIDTLENAHQYSSLHPLFAKAFEYLNTNSLNDLPDGTVEIADGLKAISSNKPGKSKESSLEKFECHRQNIDIQVCVKGTETIGWKPLQNCKTSKSVYNAEKDVQFFLDEPETYFQLHSGQFVILYPEDVHAPMIGRDDALIKKIVFKVKI